MRRTIISIGIALAYTGLLFLSGCTPKEQPPTQDPNTVLLTVPDCEDPDVKPVCYTLDEGQYRLVEDYNPYQFKALHECPTDQGGKDLPCIYLGGYAANGGRYVFDKR